MDEISGGPEFKAGYEWAERWGWRDRCLTAEAKLGQIETLTVLSVKSNGSGDLQALQDAIFQVLGAANG